METIGPLSRGAGAYQPSVHTNDKPVPSSDAFSNTGFNKSGASASYSRLQYQSETIELSSQGRAQSQRSVSVDLSTSTATFARVAPANNLSHPPESSANTIVNFIEQKLKQVSKEGGDKEALEGVLSDGLIGYETGRDEALEILKGYGFLTDDVKAGIDKTTELVKAGLEELKSQYIDGNPPSSGSKPADMLSQETAVTANNPQERLDSLANSLKIVPKSPRVDEFNHQIAQYQQQISNSQSIDFKVQTLDGDLVTLTFSSASQSSESYGYQSAQSTDGKHISGYAFNASFSASQDYKLSIEGDLDEDELKAIQDLMEEIGQLSEDFFDGDMQAAFEQAMNIGFDTSELAAFTLNLTQTESVKVASYKEQVSSNTSNNPFVTRLAPVGERMTELAQNAIESNQGLNYLALLEPVLAIALAFKADEKQGQDTENSVQDLAATSEEASKERPQLGISPKSDYLFELLSMATLRQQMVMQTDKMATEMNDKSALK